MVVLDLRPSYPLFDDNLLVEGSFVLAGSLLLDVGGGGAKFHDWLLVEHGQLLGVKLRSMESNLFLTLRHSWNVRRLILLLVLLDAYSELATLNLLFLEQVLSFFIV